MCRLRVLETSATMSDFDILPLMHHDPLASPQPHVSRLNISSSTVYLKAMTTSSITFLMIYRAGIWSHLDSIKLPIRSAHGCIFIRYSFLFDEDCDETEVVEPILDALPLLRQKVLIVDDIADLSDDVRSLDVRA